MRTKYAISYCVRFCIVIALHDLYLHDLEAPLPKTPQQRHMYRQEKSVPQKDSFRRAGP